MSKMQLFPRWESRERSPLNSETEHSRDDCFWMNAQERDCPNLQLAILPAHRVCGLEPDRRCCGHMKCLAARSSTTGRSAAWGRRKRPNPLAASPILGAGLRRVLSDLALTTPGVLLYHPGKRQVPPKLRAFIDHVKARS